MWIAVTIGAIIREKPEKEREQINYKFAVGLSKYFMVMLSIQFVIAISLLILSFVK